MQREIEVMEKDKEYIEFLENKVIVAESFGFEPYPNLEILKPHQNDIVNWCIDGGRRAIFASFGLGKTFMQLSIARQIIQKTNMPFLIALPLGVVGEFKRDNEKINSGYEIEYITDTDTIDNYEPKIYVTNYARIRMGDIDSSKFGGVSFDEASILRNLKTETTNYVLDYFTKIPYRFVATATPTPNDFIEILNYAVFLGVVDRGHALTRFFQRDSTKAGHLTLYENKKDEFWKWVSTWAIFVNKPSDLGYDDTGYDLPELEFKDIIVYNELKEDVIDDNGQISLIKKAPKGLSEQSKEKFDSIELRCRKAVEFAKEHHQNDNIIFWHHREAERVELEKLLKGEDYRSVYGGQSNTMKEDLLMEFSDGKYKYLLTKPQIAGSGCNFQKYCNVNIFVGIDDKFNDFIQAMHRTQRFGQTKKVYAYVFLTQNETNTLKNILRKWKQHIELQTEMINIVREYGLNTEKIRSDMKRQMFNSGKEIKVGKATCVNGDTVPLTRSMDSNSQGLIVTSIPFGDHYEYSDNYNCFGHNNGNTEFWKQMDFLIPEMHRVLKPGRVACIHVKDRIRYSYQNGAGFTTIEDFGAETSRAFQKHGFWLIGKITVTTDVVRENNQTYRLGWSEQCKDASKMGVGLPEYIYLFRKKPTSNDNAYADEPVMKYKTNKSKMYDCHECKTSFEPLEVKKISSKDKTKYICPKCQSHHDEAEINKHSYDVIDEEKLTYEIDRWQLDAHAYWRTAGDRFMTPEDMTKYDMKHVFNKWKSFSIEQMYDFRDHLQSCRDLEELGKLSRLFMTLPTISNNQLVWTDINRMNTLNANQANKKKEKHICLAEGTLILTKRGYIPIQDINVNEDETLTHTGKWKKIVAKKLTQKDAETVQVKAQGVPNLKVTPTHKIWSRIHKGYRPSETFQKVDPDWSEAKSLKSHYVNQKLAPELYSKLNETDCWIIGRWLADGHIDFRGHQYFISVGKKKVSDFEEKANEFIGAINDKGSSIQYGMKNLPMEVRNILSKCGKGAENKVLPVELISLNIEKSKALLQGYLSGDGHVDKLGNWQFASVSRALLLGFSMVIQRAYGFIPSVYKWKKAGNHIIEGREVNAKTCWVMAVKTSGHHSFGKILEDGAWKKVRDVFNSGKSDVWNISVEDDASYTAEGCIVKNCPLQLDIIERCINRFSMKTDSVFDPFGGLLSTSYIATKLGRESRCHELNSEYFADGLFHLKALEYKISTPTLFDL